MGSKSKMPGQRRIPWTHSRVRSAKHHKAVIHWTALIFGADLVRQKLLDNMYGSLERNGQLDTITTPELPPK